MNTKKISIYTCIDDYGLGPIHNEIIREISRRGATSGVSTFVGMMDFQAEAKALSDISKETNCEIGLHLDFTQFFPLIRNSSIVSPLGASVSSNFVSILSRIPELIL